MPDIYHGETDQPPLHGYRGEAPAVVARWPCGLTVALSRDAVARDGSIAKRVGPTLGWLVVEQDQPEYVRAHLNRQRDVPCAYDLRVNSGVRVEEACADLIAQAARTKLLQADLGSPCPDQARRRVSAAFTAFRTALDDLTGTFTPRVC